MPTPKGKMKVLKPTTRKLKKKSSTSSLSKGLCYQRQGAERRNMKSSTMRQAEELRFRLDANYPSFTKFLLRSHVASCFWMGLPHSFCKMYLPQKDTYFMLEDPNGNQYSAKYLARKTALSGGWRGFSIAKELLEGDAMVFQLVQPAKFKVYIIRKSEMAEKDESRVIPNLPTEVKQTGNGVEVGILERLLKHIASLSAVAQDKDQEVPLSDSKPQISQQAELLEKDISEFSLGNSRDALHLPAVGYGGIGNFEKFVKLIDELLKNEYELPHDIKCIYYQLCCSQNVLLHIHLLKDINSFLIAGSIIETVRVAVAIKSCELHNFNDEYAIWDEKVKSLKHLGMEVEFLLSHIHHLQRIAYDQEAAKNKQQYLEMCLEHADSNNKIKDLEAKLSELVSAIDKRADDIEKLKSAIDNRKSRFQEQVSAPW